jgi:hypothetical protein
MRYVVLKQITWVTCLTRVTLEDTRPHDLSRIAQTSVTDWLREASGAQLPAHRSCLEKRAAGPGTRTGLRAAVEVFYMACLRDERRNNEVRSELMRGESCNPAKSGG